ncbi:uncharacterized protein BDW70DRAFT_71971 [Aspergillus foveolatus]|uniref:uncharacterized protein n=1 Tax=Aspergillus foveolatus TaxID=210207 RepID=UPI003CCCCD4C
MGNSPPFLYGPPDAFSFRGPTDPPFNPKAVTQASWTRPPPKKKQKGPLINFNRHPDSYCNLPDGRSQWTPMSPRTKPKVFYGRKIQLGLRVLSLIGALGSLFCAIVIKNVAVSIIWIIRVGPAVAILHTLYAVYHLCRSPVTRPPGSQASYMLFATTLDLGLVPFYTFAAYLGYKEYTAGTYNWQTLLSTDTDVITTIAKATFYLSVVNGGLHLISLGISAFLFNIFRQIAQLPPDLNPLEDNLTSRLHKRTKSEIAEKHASSSTLDSTNSVAQPLIGVPRTIPFTHTRAKSSEGNSLRPPVDMVKQRGNSQSSIPEMPFRSRANTLEEPYEIPLHDTDFEARPTSSIPSSTPLRQPSPEIPTRSQCVSPASDNTTSDNWIAFPSRSVSLNEDVDNGGAAPREPSSVYSRTGTPGSLNGVVDWMGLAQKYGWDIGETISEDLRGEYESLAMHEYYGNDDDSHNVRKNGLYDHDEKDEHDIGNHRIDIYQDHEDSDEGHGNTLRVNPLGLNPPTPQPMPNSTETKTVPGRMVLGDIPNLSPTPPKHKVPPLERPEKERFYNGADIHTVTDDDSKSAKKTKLVKRKSHKLNSYGPLQQQSEDSAEKYHEPRPATDPAVTDRDRKGRVVSNSGADFGRRVGQGPNLSYGNYIAGLGVGRRRDVSGKMAEEGRGGIDSPSSKSTSGNGNGNPNSTPRAAGWARFAGL